MCEIKEVYKNRKTNGFADASKVTLTAGSIFEKSERTGLSYIKSVEVDRLLVPSFEMHGLSAPNGAARYGGWERKGANNWGSSPESFTLAGHSLGHWMSAAAVFYNNTGDAGILQKLNYAVDKLDELQNTDMGSGAKAVSKAYIGGCPEDTFIKCFAGNTKWDSGYWVPWYGIHKIYQGLADAYLYTGNKKAFGVLKKFADWAVDGTSGLTDDKMQSVLNIEYGGMNEIFALMHEFTGEKKYLTAARRFTHDGVINPLIAGTDSLTGLHANTQIPKIIGAAAIYEQDPQKYADYRTASENFRNFVVNDRSYAIGGNSIAEHFEERGSESLGVKTCESCNTYNMMRLTEHLFSWEHKSEYMDWYEDALYNHILGQQEPKSGAKMYFVSLLQGHHRVYEDKGNSWWCCTGTGMENPGRYTRCVYYEDGDDLYVNLYMQNTYRWEAKGFTFETETNYPYSENIKMTVTEGKGRAAIHLRTPGWLTEKMTVTVGDKNYTAAGGGYLTVAREWSRGDVINIIIPMRVRTYYSRESKKIAYKYGPVTLAAPLGSVEGVSGVCEYIGNETVIDTKTAEVPYLTGVGDKPEGIVETVDKSALIFKIPAEYNSSGEDITLMPFYGIHHQFYTVYWNTEADKSQVFEKALNDITIDKVEPDGQQDELGHGKETNTSESIHQGSFALRDGKTHMYRDAWGRVDPGSGELPYFSYNMRTVSGAKNYLYAAYRGSDAPFTNAGGTYTRDFEILVDDVKIAEQTINRNRENGVYYEFYEIPAELTANRESVKVKFRAKSATSCAGILELRTTSAQIINK